MRILLSHVDFIEYKPVKKEIESAENVDQKVRRVEEAVVAFVAVEKEDGEGKVETAINEILKSLENLGVRRVVIYPFAHLSNELKKPSEALEVLKRMEVLLKQKGVETYRAPFGWCKNLHIKVKEHHLAEQLKVV
ncbi:MAG: threonyl-tRNA synthetase editing domain-containing protein [Candidatus Aenigmarchaeota archaeon]|nr:threonyl-tRNA synthetase editing domain-containing protein [Candidatus Aenigmarchaeota archaeon]